MSTATTHIEIEKQLVPALRFKGFAGNWHLHSLSEFINDMGSGWSPTCLADAAKKGEWGSLKTTSITWKGYAPEENKKLPEKLEPREDIEVCIDDILITRVGPKDRVGVVVHVNKEWSKLMVSDNMFRLKLKEGIDPSFTPLILGSYSVQKEWKRKIAGLASAQVVINQKTLNKTTLKLPSLPEQQKIASFLSSVDEKIQQLTKKKALLEQYKKGVMQQLFSGQLRFKDEIGNDYPDWEKKVFSDLYSFHSTNSLSRDKLNYDSGSVYNIHYGDIHTKFKTAFKLNNEYVPYVNDNVDLSKIKTDSYCKNGDLVMADASEDYADIGKTIELINLGDEKVLAGLHTFLARPITSQIAIGFFSILLKSWSMRKQIMVIAQGTKVLSLSTGRVGKLKLNLPVIEEQQKIATYLSSIDTKIEAVNKQITQTQTFKKGLLQQMFVAA